MIINSPYISGSLTVTGNIIASGSITLSGSVASASYAANADLLDGLDATVFTLTSSFAAQTASFTAFTASILAQTASLNSFSASVLSYTASQNILNGTYTLTSSFAAQTASFTAFTASILAQTASLNSFSSSILTFTGSAATRLGALEAATASLYTATSSLNSFSASILAQTASLNSFSASILTFTGSAATRIGALEAATASLYTATSSLNASVASLNSYTSSTDAKIASIYSTTSSLNTRVGTLEAYTASLNNKTSSFATTGSNTFIGNQTITGSILQSGSFTSTGTLTAQTLVVQTITSSVVYSSGSNIFGNAIGNTQIFTGSLSVTGSTASFAGNVGIGSTSPAYKLDVNGSIKTQATGAGTGILLHTNTGWTINSNSAQLWTGQTSGFAFQLNSTGDGTNEKVRIDGSGNVGIGTTNPTNKLVVQGGASFRGGTNVTQANYNDSGSTVDIVVDNQQPKIYSSYWSGTEKNLYLGTYSQQSLLVLTTGGNVGIGTTSPLAKLAVGNGSLSDANLPIQISSAGSGTERWIGINKSGSYGLLVGYYESTSLAGSGSYIRQVTTDPLFFAVNNTTTAMTILSNGNIGIGTTSPAHKLDVIGDIAIPSSNYIQYYTGASYYGRIQLWNSANGDMTFQNASGGTSHMIFLPQGNVGIGTTSPSAKLHIANGSFGLNGTDANFPFFVTDTSTSTNRYNLASKGMGFNLTDDYAQLQLFGGNGAYIDFANASEDYDARIIYVGGSYLSMQYGTNMYINSTGVGIGTTSPAYKLEVTGELGVNYTNAISTIKGGTGYSIFRMYAGNGVSTDVVEFQIRNRSDSADFSTMGNYSNHDVRIRTNNTDKVTIQAGGNVGIGTTSPATKLQVVGETDTSILTVSNTTNGQFQSRINANDVNSQGACRWRTYARGIVATGTGTKLNIPFYSQGNLNIVTIARVLVCSADFNSSYGGAAQFMFSVGSLNALSNLQILSSGGNYSSATTSGMNVVVTLGSFVAAYIVIEYLTPEPSYSIDLGNITLTS